MNVLIQPGTARGTVAAPPSKSMAHRLLICAALSEGESTVYGVDRSEDILATSTAFPPWEHPSTGREPPSISKAVIPAAPARLS